MLMLLSLEAMAPNPSWYNKAVSFLVEWRIVFNPISKTSLQDHLLHLTLLNQCFGKISTSETQVACMNRVGDAEVHHISHVSILHSFYTYTQKPNLQALYFLFFH